MKTGSIKSSTTKKSTVVAGLILAGFISMAAMPSVALAAEAGKATAKSVKTDISDAKETAAVTKKGIEDYLADKAKQDSANQARLGELQQKMSDLEAAIAGIESDTAELKKSKSALKAQLGGAQDDVKTTSTGATYQRVKSGNEMGYQELVAGKLTGPIFLDGKDDQDNKTFDQAQEYCKAMGAHTATKEELEHISVNGNKAYADILGMNTMIASGKYKDRYKRFIWSGSPSGGNDAFDLNGANGFVVVYNRSHVFGSARCVR